MTILTILRRLIPFVVYGVTCASCRRRCTFSTDCRLRFFCSTVCIQKEREKHFKNFFGTTFITIKTGSTFTKTFKQSLFSLETKGILV